MPFLCQLGREKVEAKYSLDSLPLTIGRQPSDTEGNKIIIKDARVSRSHARIEAVDGGQLVLIDNQSTHHTYVNQQSIDRRILIHGDLISVGNKIDFLFLEREDDTLLAEVLKRQNVDAGISPDSSYAGYVDQKMGTLMDQLQSTSVDTAVVKKISNEISRSMSELKCLYEITGAISSELDLERVLDLIITHVIRATGAERGFVMLRDPQTGKLVPKVARNMESTLDDVQKTQFARSICNKVVERKATLWTKDTLLDPSISTKSIVDYNIRSAICAPLMAKGQVIGVLYVDSKQSIKDYSDKDAEFFTALANQSAIAIENAQLLRNLKMANQQLQRKLTELSALYSISQTLLNSTNLEKVLEAILEKSIETIGAERGSLMLYADGQDYLTVRVVCGRVNEAIKDRVKIRKGEGIAGKVVETGIGIISNTGSKDSQFKRLSDKESDVRQILCVPLKGNREVIGTINLINKTNNRDFREDDLQLMSSIASQAAVTIENSRLYNLAIFDGLTAVHVRRFFEAWLLKEYERARRYGTDVSLIMCDIDRFKLVNDTHGHLVGDIVLQEVARILKESVRESDLVARYGGEEFILGLPQTPLTGAEQFADRLRRRIEAHEIRVKGVRIPVTISLGVCSFKVSVPPDPVKFKDYADRALYEAKHTGRNRVVLHHPSMEKDPQKEKTSPLMTGAFRVPTSTQGGSQGS
ncbi:MAG: diguanylate cyclase [Candidatus Riflebacteria bacterium]|nr:diguanylate cyclase [Candidatus Riflebacteria bacterium]